MKTFKYLALMLIALVGMTACSSDDNNEHPTPVIDPVEHEFTGYIYVTSAYFTDMYYGNNAVLKVYTEEDKYVVSFSDPQWGNATFNDVKVGAELSGTGTLTMTYRGQEGSYNAILSGSMTTPVITLPDVMGGTTIKFHAGTPSPAVLISGNYNGTNTVVVGGTYPYDAQINYTITTNSDSTINIVVPEYQLEGTVMGDLTLGAYTISNIAYDEEKNAFYRQYGSDGLSQHLTVVKDGVTSMDQDYNFAEESFVLIESTESGIKVVNSFNLGRMPFPIVASFEGSKQTRP